MATEQIRRLNEIMAGRYLVVKEVGRSGSGILYHALDLAHNRDVALRVTPQGYDPDIIGAIRAVWERAAKVSSDHAVRVFEIGEVEGEAEAFAACEWLDAASLDDRGHFTLPLVAGDVRQIVTDVARALADGRRAKVAYDALRPSCIMVDRATGRAKLDFTGARIIPPGEFPMVVGRPIYMAPEIMRGNPPSERSDIYSLGAIAYELLTGAPPFDRLPTDQLLVQRITEDAPQVNSLTAAPPDLARAIDRCLARNPVNRWTDFEQLAEALIAGADKLHDRDLLSGALGHLFRALWDAPLSQDAHGSIYPARDIARNILVDVRVPNPRQFADPAALDSARRVWHRAAQIESEYATRVVEVSREHGNPFVTCERVAGASDFGGRLDRRLSQQRTLPFSKVKGIIHDVARALADARKSGVGHGDLRLSAIISDSTLSRSAVDFTAGRDDPALTEHDDLQALGVIAWEALTGYPPAPRMDAAEMMMGESPFSSIATVVKLEPGEAKLIDWCFGDIPSRRWASAQQLADACNKSDPI